MADFIYEGNRKHNDTLSIFTFKAVKPESKMLEGVPFDITAENYDAAVEKLQEFIRDAVVVEDA